MRRLHWMKTFSNIHFFCFLSVAGLSLTLITQPTIAINGNTRFAATALNSFIAVQSDTVDTLTWKKPRFSERKKERHMLVNEELSKHITDEKVLEAMRHVPRHLFIPKQYRAYAYQNRPLPIGQGQTISQPFVVAYMTQLLELQFGEKVLEIGTGSGYQAAVLSEITPYVYTIEIIPELAEQANKRFEKLGYPTIKTKIGDGYKGWKKYAPYDAIIVTAAPPEIPQPLINQLKPGGVLVTPVGPSGQTQILTTLTKLKSGKIKRELVISVRFVPMTGQAQQE